MTAESNIDPDRLILGGENPDMGPELDIQALGSFCRISRFRERILTQHLKYRENFLNLELYEFN